MAHTHKTRRLTYLLVWLAFVGSLLCFGPRAKAAIDPAQGPGGPILIVTSSSIHLRDLLRGDPENRGLQRVRGHRHRERLGEHPRCVRRRAPRRDAAHQRAGHDAEQLGHGGRQSDRDEPRSEPRRPARADGDGQYARRSLPARRHVDRRRQRHRRRDDPVPRHGRPVHVERRNRYRDAVQQRNYRDEQSGRHLARRGRRTGRRVRLRPGDFRRLHATGQSRLGGTGTRRSSPDPLGRQVFRQCGGRSAARLDRPGQGPHPPGRRTAAAARQPDPLDEFQSQALAPVLVLPERQEGGRDHDRRRPWERRDDRSLRHLQVAQPGRVLGRQLGMHQVDVLHLYVGHHDGCTGGPIHRRWFRDRLAHHHRLQRLHAGVAASHLRAAGARVAVGLPERRPDS